MDVSLPCLGAVLNRRHNVQNRVFNSKNLTYMTICLEGQYYVFPHAVNTTTRIKSSHVTSIELRCYLFLPLLQVPYSGQTMSNPGMERGFVNTNGLHGFFNLTKAI
jgi:hypothetical protein